MTKRERIVAAVLAALAVLVMLSSAFFIVAHAEHDCEGEDCPICEQLCACVKSFQRFTITVLVAAAVALTCACDIRLGGKVCAFAPSTPILLKVKLSN